MIENKLLLHCSPLGLRDGVEANLYMGRVSDGAPGYLLCVGRKHPPRQKKVRHEFMGNLDRARWENCEVGLEKHVSRGSMEVGKKHWLVSTREYLLKMRYYLPMGQEETPSRCQLASILSHSSPSTWTYEQSSHGGSDGGYA